MITTFITTIVTIHIKMRPFFPRLKSYIGYRKYQQDKYTLVFKFISATIKKNLSKMIFEENQKKFPEQNFGKNKIWGKNF